MYYGTYCINFSEINKMTRKKSKEVKYHNITDGAQTVLIRNTLIVWFYW